jgi:hypothetical protein
VKKNGFARKHDPQIVGIALNFGHSLEASIYSKPQASVNLWPSNMQGTGSVVMFPLDLARPVKMGKDLRINQYVYQNTANTTEIQKPFQMPNELTKQNLVFFHPSIFSISQHGQKSTNQHRDFTKERPDPANNQSQVASAQCTNLVSLWLSFTSHGLEQPSHMC